MTAKTAGYTLIEILVVIGLIGLALALAWPKKDNQSFVPGQFTEALKAYLGAAAAGADARQNTVCVFRSNDTIYTQPKTQDDLKIPGDIQTNFSNICFDPTGRPTVPVDIGVKHIKDTDYTLHLKSSGSYGQFEVIR